MTSDMTAPATGSATPNQGAAAEMAPEVPHSATNAAMQMMDACKQLIALHQTPAALVCLRNLVAAHPGTSTALTAATLLTSLETVSSAEQTPTTHSADGIAFDPADNAVDSPASEDKGVVNLDGAAASLKYTFELGRLEIASTGLLLGFASGPVLMMLAA